MNGTLEIHINKKCEEVAELDKVRVDTGVKITIMSTISSSTMDFKVAKIASSAGNVTKSSTKLLRVA